MELGVKGILAKAWKVKQATNSGASMQTGQRLATGSLGRATTSVLTPLHKTVQATRVYKSKRVSRSSLEEPKTLRNNTKSGHNTSERRYSI